MGSERTSVGLFCLTSVPIRVLKHYVTFILADKKKENIQNSFSIHTCTVGQVNVNRFHYRASFLHIGLIG